MSFRNFLLLYFLANSDKTTLYEIHGIPEIPELTEETSSNSYGLSQSHGQPPRGPEQGDGQGQQFILDKYVDDPGKITIR